MKTQIEEINKNSVLTDQGLPQGLPASQSHYRSDEKANKAPTSSKPKKNTTAQKQGKTQGRWTQEEHERFLTAIELYDKDWKKVTEFVATRISAQVRSHAQKVLSDYSIAARSQPQTKGANSVSNKGSSKAESSSNDITKMYAHDFQEPATLRKRHNTSRQHEIQIDEDTFKHKRRYTDDHHQLPDSHVFLKPRTSSQVSSSKQSVISSPPRPTIRMQEHYLQLQQQESVATTTQPLNPIQNNGQKSSIFMQQCAASEYQKLAARLDALVVRRQQISEQLYLVTQTSSTAIETRFVELQREAASLMSMIRPILQAIRQLPSQDLKTQLLQRAVILSIDTKYLGLTVHELLSTDEILPQQKFSTPSSSQSAHFIDTSGSRTQSLSQILCNQQPATILMKTPVTQSGQSKFGYPQLIPSSCSKVLHPQAVRAGTSVSQQVGQPTNQSNTTDFNNIAQTMKEGSNLAQILRQMLSSDIPGSGCSTGSTHGGGFNYMNLHGMSNSRIVTPQATSHRNSFSGNK